MYIYRCQPAPMNTRVMCPCRYGFVEFEDNRDADDAVYELNGKELCGERVIIEHARGPRRDGYGYGGGGGGGGGGRDGGGGRSSESNDATTATLVLLCRIE